MNGESDIDFKIEEGILDVHEINSLLKDEALEEFESLEKIFANDILEKVEDDKIKRKSEKPESFIKKNIKTQGQASKRYIPKNGINFYKCDHKPKQKEYNKNLIKKPINKIQEERELRLLEKIYQFESSEDDDSKLKDLKSKYHHSLEELARAQNMIDSLRFGNKTIDINDLTKNEINKSFLDTSSTQTYIRQDTSSPENEKSSSSLESSFEQTKNINESKRFVSEIKVENMPFLSHYSTLYINKPSNYILNKQIYDDIKPTITKNQNFINDNNLIYRLKTKFQMKIHNKN